MALVISIELLSGGYDAAEVDDRERAEWPPHPARVFCALVAAAREERERAALRWLEEQPPPMIEAAARSQESRREAYVVTNTLSLKGGSQTHAGRTNGLRARTRVMPWSPRVRMVWPVDAEPQVVEALEAMARRIPYLGRSTGVALVAASAAAPHELGAPAPGCVQHEPCDLLETETSVRVPYPGFLADLDTQFALGRPAWEVRRYRGYRRLRSADGLAHGQRGFEDSSAGAAGRGPERPSVFPDVVVFRFAGLRPDARLTVRFTEALRRATLAAAGEGAPHVLHGHGADGRPHVAFLALPDVGFPHSDGHLLGLAVAVPELPKAQRQAVLRAVLGLRREDLQGVAQLRVPDIGAVELMYQPGLVRPWGASPERWRQGSRRWVMATPVVLDRYPKRPGQIETEVRAGARLVGLPEPVDVQISAEPLTPGAARLRPIDLPRRAKGRLFRHVSLTFDEVVHGPVLLGAGRYLGVGLLCPAPLGRREDGPDA